MSTPGQPERAERYEPFFGLSEAPFSLDPDPRFLFASASHSAALAQVASAIDRREPLVVITGEVGTGKTLLCRIVLRELQRRTCLSVISDPRLGRDDLLKQLLQDFGLISKDRARHTEASRHDLIQALGGFLRSLTPIKAHATVIIDEAQLVQPDVLEQIRLLLNIDDERGTLLQIILVGQTDLEPLLSRPELRQLQQLVARRFRLEPLIGDEVQPYIEHRLAAARDVTPPQHAVGPTDASPDPAGAVGENAGVEFTPDAIHAVSQLSGGRPRVINLLCDRSLEEAYASRLRTIDGPLIQTAARALGIGDRAVPTGTPAALSAIAGITRIGLDESFWTAPGSESETRGKTQPVDQTVPLGFSERARPAAGPRLARYSVLAVSFAVAVGAILFAVRSTRRPAAQAPFAEATAPSSATRASAGRPGAASAAASRLAPQTTGTAGTPPPPRVTAPAPQRVAATPTGGRFDIVVASFRTDARATSVADAVRALGLPIRRRVADGWQQVISGPFASRPDAEQAQERLTRAGLTGTRIVVTAPE